MTLLLNRRKVDEVAVSNQIKDAIPKGTPHIRTVEGPETTIHCLEGSNLDLFRDNLLGDRFFSGSAHDAIQSAWQAKKVYILCDYKQMAVVSDQDRADFAVYGEVYDGFDKLRKQERTLIDRLTESCQALQLRAAAQLENPAA